MSPLHAKGAEGFKDFQKANGELWGKALAFSEAAELRQTVNKPQRHPLLPPIGFSMHLLFGSSELVLAGVELISQAATDEFWI